MSALEERATLALEEPSTEALARIRAWLAAVRASARAVAVGHPCLLVTPLGMASRARLDAELAARGIAIATRIPIERWPEISTAVQLKRFDPRHLRRAVLYEAAWRALFPDGRAEAWRIDPAGHLRLAAEKPRLREGLRTVAVRFGAGGVDRGVLHPFHLADVEDAGLEARRLEAALSALRRDG